MKYYVKTIIAIIILFLLDFMAIPKLVSYPDDFLVMLGIFLVAMNPVFVYWAAKFVINKKEK